MTENKKSRGRGPRVTEEQLEKMVSLYLEGKTFQSIAKEVKRHWQTVRKYTLKTLQEKEGQELRREALKGALVDHYKDLVDALGCLEELLEMPEVVRLESPNGWQPSVPERRNRLLLQALREFHTKDSPLWSWWDIWNQARDTYEKSLSALRRRVTGDIARMEKSYPEVSFTEGLDEVLFYSGVSLAQGYSRYDVSMLRVRPRIDSEGKTDGEELWLGESTRLATGPGMNSLREKISEAIEVMGKWEEVEELEKLYHQMADLKGNIEEEAAVLSLRRAFPGRCRLCPA